MSTNHTSGSAFSPPLIAPPQQQPACPTAATRKRLALSIASCFGLAGVATPACAILLVTNCNNSGSGSLRDTVANAADGSSIGMSPTIGCSKITLTSGSISTTLQNLSIAGTGQNTFTIDGNKNGGVFFSNHSGGGNLALSNMTVTNGKQLGGACAYVNGNLTLDHVTVSYCTSPGDANGGNVAGGVRTHYGNLTMTNSTLTHNTDIFVAGGGAFIQGDATITDSTISNNTLTDLIDAAETVRGGGLYVAGNLKMTGSVVSGNTATATSAQASITGGGIYAGGDALIYSSVIASNSASGPGTMIQGGGIFVGPKSGKVTDASFQYSTVSGNSISSTTQATLALVRGGGIYSQKFTEIINSTVDTNHSNGQGGGIATSAHLNLRMSTISGNQTQFQGGAVYSSYNGTSQTLNSTIGLNYTQGISQCAGMFFANGGILDSESSIIAKNSKYNMASAACDISFGTGKIFTIDAANGHNLIQHSSVATPSDTLTGDPQFFPLEYNGGPTRTLGLMSGSPALGAGSNIFGVEWDQRGPGYPREIGNPDIGALESEGAADGDTIFRNGFDLLIE